ncbi:MAG: Uma2 family endonuclease [Hyphomicrobiales bacterium]
MTRARQRAPVPLEEFLGWPEESPALELVDGVVEQKPVGNFDHAMAAKRLERILESHPATAGGLALTELGTSYPRTPRGNHRVPGVSCFRGGPPPLDDRRYPTIPPDLAAEIRSPGQPATVLRKRLDFLLEQGVSVGLLVDPTQRTVTVLDGVRPPVTFSGDATVTTSAFGLEFPLADLFD